MHVLEMGESSGWNMDLAWRRVQLELALALRVAALTVLSLQQRHQLLVLNRSLIVLGCPSRDCFL